MPHDSGPEATTVSPSSIRAIWSPAGSAAGAYDQSAAARTNTATAAKQAPTAIERYPLSFSMVACPKTLTTRLSAETATSSRMLRPSGSVMPTLASRASLASVVKATFRTM